MKLGRYGLLLLLAWGTQLFAEENLRQVEAPNGKVKFVLSQEKAGAPLTYRVDFNNRTVSL